MTKDTVKNYTLYKLRFWIGYGALLIILASVLVFAALYVPGGFTPAEQQSALRSASLSLSHPETLLIVDLPYHALQRLSMSVFGLDSFSVTLPSLLFGLLAAIGIVLVISRRFSHTVGILTGGIITISAFFISLSATGDPTVMMVFWPVALLTIASFGINRRKLHPAAIYIGSITAALSLFTPFSIYILLALLIGGLLHPHIRYLFRKAPPEAIWTGAVIIAVALGVIAYGAYRDITLLTDLLYRSSHFSLDILANATLIGSQLIDFSSTSTTTTGLLAPVFGLSALTLAGVGVYSLAYWRHSVVSYIVFSWTLMLIPILLLNPTSLALLIVPLTFLVAAGSNYLLRYWYKLFPRNPYARIFALMPVTILFACIILSGVTRYFYAFHYYAPLANAPSHDTTLVERELRDNPSATLLVAPSEKPWYRLYLDANHLDDVALSDSTNRLIHGGALTDDVIATKASSLTTSSAFIPSSVTAWSNYQGSSDRLYIYKKTAR